MAFEALMNFGKGSSDLIGAVGSLFGGSGSQQGKTTGTASSTTTAKASGIQTEQLQLEDEAVQQIIRDVLGGPDGLASIFAGAQSAGIFNSSVANQAAGDLAAKLVGELAKITGKTVGTTEQEEEQITEQEQETISKVDTKDKGVLGGIGDFFGF